MSSKVQSIVSLLVSTEHGVGFWDAERRELRGPFVVHLSPEPREIRPASELEAQLFYSLRHETRKRLCAAYDRDGRAAEIIAWHDELQKSLGVDPLEVDRARHRSEHSPLADDSGD